MITFVAFHMEMLQKNVLELRKRLPFFTHYRPEVFLKTMFDSATLFHPQCRKILLADSKLSFSLGSSIEIKKNPIATQKVVLEHQAACVEFLKQADPSSHYVFLDSDILINDHLESIFDNTFDFGLTSRKAHPKMPINTGVIFIHRNGISAAISFFEEVVQVIKKMPQAGLKLWFGDQLAILDLIGGDRIQNHTSEPIQVRDWDILLLPCDLYNFSTDHGISMNAHYPDKKILHFKGPRKVQMLAYWKKYLQPHLKKEKDQ